MIDQERLVEPDAESQADALVDQIFEDGGDIFESDDDAPEEDGEPAAEETEEPEADAKVDENKGADDAEPDADDYIELPPGGEEGGEPTRLKLDDVMAGYNEAEGLRKEIATLRETPPPPPEYTQELQQTLQARQNLIHQIEAAQQYGQPQAPDMDLANPASPNYSPDAYFSQHEQFVQAQQAQYDMQQANQRLQQDQQQEYAVLQQANSRQQQALLTQFWPEQASDPAVGQQFQSDVVKYLGKYGATAEALAGVSEAMPLMVLKFAVDHLKGQQAQETAVKAVKAKPKLVRSAAAPKQSKGAGQLQRLKKTGEIEDATSYLESLF